MNTDPTAGRGAFGAWGRFVYRFRWLVLIVSILSLPFAVFLMRFGGQFSNGSPGYHTESERAYHLMEKQLPSSPINFDIIFSSPTMHATEPRFVAEVNSALWPLRNDPHVAAIQTAYDDQAGPKAGVSISANPQLVSRDGMRTMAVVDLKGKMQSLMKAYPHLADKVHSKTLHVSFAGGLPLDDNFNKAAETDLQHGEDASLPVVLILLLAVFGSVVAAGLPLGVGILAIMGALTGTVIMAQFTSVSSYSINIITMIGLGVAIDYSLLIVSRFREEVNRRPIAEALARTMETAGRAIVFSGTTIAIGLLGMMFFHFGNMGTMGEAGTLSVALAVLYALTFLAAMLAILGRRVNAVRIPFTHPDRTTTGHGAWHSLSRAVMARPWQVLIPTVVLLLALGLPLLHLRLANSDYTALPKSSPARQAQELMTNQFPGGKINEVSVVLQFTDGKPLSATHIGELAGFTRWAGNLPHVAKVESAVTLNPTYSLADYQRAYAGSLSSLDGPTRAAVRQLVGKNIAIVNLYTPARASSDAAQTIVKTVRNHHPRIDAAVSVTGDTAFNIDYVQVLFQDAPVALAFMTIATYIVLFLLLGSTLLPLKAIVMNLLSISASYGALVWIFQDGHLASLLGFTPNPIDIALPSILFCILFGLSMDYEVMLLSRFKEIYNRTGDNTEAVALGLERTGRLVTGAAAIMATVFFGFGIFADTTIIKAFGLGMGIAVVVDAAIVRTLLVPATMRLLGDWNWWAPAPLARLYHRLGLAESGEADGDEEDVITVAA